MPDMRDTNTAPSSELPSSRSLLRSTAIAAATAAVLLVTAVLPAEYGVDPTGIGRVLGLTQMGEIKRELAMEAAATAAAAEAAAPAPVAAEAAAPVPSTTTATTAGLPAAAPAAPAARPPGGVGAAKFDAVHVTLRPGEGKEIKLAMRQGASVNYSWSTDRGVVNYDTHADRSEAPAIKYHGYAKGQGKRADQGVLVAAFDGMHGWFWRNRTREVVTVTLRTEGDYRQLKRME